MTAIVITECRNAVAIDEACTHFDVEINHPTDGWIWYRLDPDDADAAIDNASLRTLIGSDYVEDARVVGRRES
ncbi:MAG: hypothetical protein VW270_30550 [Candidatus Poseidoniales archaeon]